MESSDGVEFSISRHGLAVTAKVTTEYFEKNVLPVISSLLAEMKDARSSLNRLEGPVEASRIITEVDTPSGKLNLSVKSIAQKLNAKTAADVIRAGAASLVFVQAKDQFSWKELLAETQKASGFWTKSHSTNGTKARDSLQSAGVLVELANGNFTLSPSAEQDLLAVLSGNGAP